MPLMPTGYFDRTDVKKLTNEQIARLTRAECLSFMRRLNPFGGYEGESLKTLRQTVKNYRDF